MNKLHRPYTFSLIVLITVLLGSCQENVLVNHQSSPSTVEKRTYFNAYNDSLITIQAINRSLHTNYKLMDLGRPIGVSGTTYWLITVGGWQLNNRNILLQGTAFRKSEEFYPNPARKTEVEFEGPFTGLIRYDQQTDAYSWLIPFGTLSKGFKYQGTQDHDLIVLNESANRLEFLDIDSEKAFAVGNGSDKILDWSLDKNTNTLVILMGKGETKAQTLQLSIDSLLTNASNIGLNE